MPAQPLFRQWWRSLQALNVDQIAAQEVFAALVTAYSSPDRHYHTLKHIQHVLSVIKFLQPKAQDETVVRLAAWFHDVVYDPRTKDNEEKSAEYAACTLRELELPTDLIAQVTRLILSTQRHQAKPHEVDCQILLDADLAILSAEPADYWKYAQAIRREYAWVPEEQYLAGRRQVLEAFLQRDRLYFTPQMFEKAESSARKNLKAEIQLFQQRSRSQTKL